MAASRGHIDALYKLGDIYSRDTWVAKDEELFTYYYLKAVNLIIDENWNTNPHVILGYTELQEYPSLCFAFYAGKPISGVLYLLFCWTFIPAIISFIQGIVALTKHADENGDIII